MPEESCYISRHLLTLLKCIFQQVAGTHLIINSRCENEILLLGQIVSNYVKQRQKGTKNGDPQAQVLCLRLHKLLDENRRVVLVRGKPFGYAQDERVGSCLFG